MSVQAVVQPWQPEQEAVRAGGEGAARRGLKVFTHRANPAKMKAAAPAAAPDAEAEAEDEVIISRLGKRMLGRNEERQLLRAWRERGDDRALARLIEAYQPLIPPLARKYANYGLGIADLLQEGNCGLMVAVNKFDLDRDVRFSTYAAWWVHSAISDYVLANWSLVRIGSSANQRKLFFQLRSLARKALVLGENLTIEEQILRVAEETGVPAPQVRSTFARMSAGEVSLNVPDPETGAEAIDLIEDPNQTPDQVDEEIDLRRERALLQLAMERLDPRERQIVEARYLGEEERSLRDIGRALSLTHERIRQLQLHALAKLKAMLTSERESLKEELQHRRTGAAPAPRPAVGAPAPAAEPRPTRVPAARRVAAAARRGRPAAARPPAPTPSMIFWSATSSLVPVGSGDRQLALRQQMVAARHAHLVKAMIVATVARRMTGRMPQFDWQPAAAEAAAVPLEAPDTAVVEPARRDIPVHPAEFMLKLLPAGIFVREPFCWRMPDEAQWTAEVVDAAPALFPAVAAGYARPSRLRWPESRPAGWG